MDFDRSKLLGCLSVCNHLLKLFYCPFPTLILNLSTLIRKNGSELFGFVGVHSVNTSNDEANRVDMKDLIEKVILHPDWNRSTRNADIALIRLNIHVLFNGKMS